MGRPFRFRPIDGKRQARSNVEVVSHSELHGGTRNRVAGYFLRVPQAVGFTHCAPPAGIDSMDKDDSVNRILCLSRDLKPS